MSFEFRRLRSGDWIAALGALALLAFMFLLPWFAIKVPNIIGAYLIAANRDTSVDAWHSLEVIRWLLLLTVLAGVSLAAFAAIDFKSRLPVPMSAIVSGLGALCTVLVLYRALLNHPFAHVEVKLGAWLGLAACAVITYGGIRALSEEVTLLADRREQAPAPIAPPL